MRRPCQYCGWSSYTPPLWLAGSAARRLCGSAARRLCSSPALRLAGSAARRLCGSPALRLAGSADRRLCGSPARGLCGLCGLSLRLAGSLAVNPRNTHVHRARALPSTGLDLSGPERGPRATAQGTPEPSTRPASSGLGIAKGLPVTFKSFGNRSRHLKTTVVRS